MKTFDDLVKNGKFITVLFLKKDGTLRRLNGRLGVRKHLKNPDQPVTLHNRSDLIVIWDAQKKQYRSFHMNTVLFIKALHKTFQPVTYDGVTKFYPTSDLGTLL